jgi:2-polyprenyl-3-methyl-5-hydroxy-6-metoxy-1,4-benzoquinol methylase
MTPDAKRWNHNIAYHGVLLDALPAQPQRVLDVGCGEGTLTRELRRRVPTTVGMDRDAQVLQMARQQDPDRQIGYVRGDLCRHPFAAGAFDAAVTVATLHHVDTATGLQRLAELVRPGGVVAVIGCARRELPRDVGWEAVAVAVHRLHRMAHPVWEHPAPTVWPPAVTYADMRRIGTEVLPGSRFRRHALWRYSLIWTKPAAT